MAGIGMGSRGAAVVVALGLLVGGAGCSTLQMVPPADVAADSDLLEPEGRSGWSGLFVDETFKIGPYEIADVDRDWNKGSGSSFGLVSGEDADGNSRYALGYTSSSVKTGFAYKVKEGAEALPARCASATEREHVTVGLRFGSEESRFLCTCGDGAGAATLEMKDDGRRKYQGRILLDRGALTVTSIHEAEGAAWDLREPAGYVVDEAGRALAAVDVLNKGRIWLGRSLHPTERRQVACLLTGLMLYEHPDED